MARRDHKRRTRSVPILPNLFTAGSLFCGMLAIFKVYSSEGHLGDGQLGEACWLVALAAVLDLADGAIARLTHTTSLFGLNFDSLCDVVAFGVAPALICFDAIGTGAPPLTTAVCILYTLCGAMRLARFNVQATQEERKTFLGVPIPGAAMVMILTVWVFDKHPDLTAWFPIDRILPPALVVIAFLMVSKVPYIGFKSLNLIGRQPFEIFVALVGMVCLLYMVRNYLPEVLCTAGWCYVAIGIGLALWRRLHQTHQEHSTVPSTDSNLSNQ